MTLPLERARSRKPVTWLTVLGVLLLPVVIGGILIAALYNPTERLDAMTVAVVNDDEPVTIDGQTAPLGRQLTAGLVEGSDEIPSNLTWTISNTDDAAEGLADGTYNAVVTIPENFSAAATSTAPGGTPEKATIRVETAPDAHIVDDAITAQVTQAAASLMGQQLSEVYLENVLLGFTTLGDQLGEAADGAHRLADGAAQAADGAAQLPDGAAQLSTGAAQLGDGAAQLADGIGGLGGGASQLAGGLGTIADGVRQSAGGATQLAAGVSDGAAQLRATGLVPDQLSTGAATAASATQQYIAGLGQLAAGCTLSGAAQAYCDQLAAAVDPTVMQGAGGVLAATQGVSDGLALFDAQATEQIAGQFDTIAGNVGTLAGGLDRLAGGIDQSTAGATALADGAGQLQRGADGIADGATQLADGATQLSDGATQLSDGVGELASGTVTLADGLTSAVDQIPSYSDSEATDLAGVVADPVSAQGVGTNLFGASAIPLLAMLALWFGGLASFVALQAVPRGALSSRRPSVLLALRAFLPAAAIGALQGALVAGIVQLAASYEAGAWWVFAGLSVVAGIVFAAVNQALVAVFGGAGRWISALVGVLAVATGIVSTVPGVLTSIAALLPTMPAYDAMLAALTPATGVTAGLVGMIVWGGLAFVVSVLAVARRRATTAAAVLASSPALA